MGRMGFSYAVLIVAASTSFSGHAQQGIRETWGSDECWDVANGSVWSNTMLCRKIPDDENTSVWDLYNAQKIAVFRFTYDDSGWIQMYQHHSQLTYRVPDRNWRRARWPRSAISARCACCGQTIDGSAHCS